MEYTKFVPDTLPLYNETKDYIPVDTLADVVPAYPVSPDVVFQNPLPTETAYAPVNSNTPPVVVNTPDGGTIIEMKAEDPADNKKSLLILAGVGVALYFLLK